VSATADRERAQELADRLRRIGSTSVTAFFGGAGIRLDGIQFAFIIEGTLYFRVDDQTRPAFEAHGSAPFRYSGHEKRVTVSSYYQVPEEVIDDPDELRKWAAKARATAARSGSARQRKSQRRSTTVRK
jgi:DNA transformation protein and related proteins